jgi:hypothetical protein
MFTEGRNFCCGTFFLLWKINGFFSTLVVLLELNFLFFVFFVWVWGFGILHYTLGFDLCFVFGLAYFLGVFRVGTGWFVPHWIRGVYGAVWECGCGSMLPNLFPTHDTLASRFLDSAGLFFKKCFCSLCVGMGALNFPTSLKALKKASFLVWRVFLLWLWVGKRVVVPLVC